MNFRKKLLSDSVSWKPLWTKLKEAVKFSIYFYLIGYFAEYNKHNKLYLYDTQN